MSSSENGKEIVLKENKKEIDLRENNKISGNKTKRT